VPCRFWLWLEHLLPLQDAQLHQIALELGPEFFIELVQIQTTFARDLNTDHWAAALALHGSEVEIEYRCLDQPTTGQWIF